MIGKRSRWGVLLFVGMLFAPLAPRPAAAADLANAQLLIAGSRLKVSPESQTVPYDTPTIVETHLEGYDASRGVLPKDLRVLADFTGPEIDGILVLETVPNQPFRIPRLRLQGEYRLDNIRLVEGEDLVAYAEPRSAAVLVTQVLITRVTSRALTLDEIRSYGIVVDDDSFQAFNFTFAFGVAGETIDYNIPVIYFGPGKEQVIGLWDLPGWHASSTRFTPPRMAPFQLKLDAPEGGRDDSYGGCEALEGDCRKDDVIPIPGVILFPTDVSLLHQFFSVVLMAQNGAPANDPLTIHDLTARVTLPPGLRQARTEPPTPLGVPVPVRVPGPDGELGTGDDLTFLVAQATGQAEVLVEGLKEGTHIVSFDLEGVLRGLPGNQVRRVTGKAQGAVIVRDPTLNVTITHPDVVREGEDYTMLLTVTNTGTAPANLMTIRLPLEKLAGVEVVGPNEKTVTVLPGDAEVVDFRLHPKRTGRVTATAARAPSSITPAFELTVGVGENGIPLSPNAIILPRAADSLPPGLIRDSLNLLGLGFSLATAPPSLLRSDLPRVSRPTVDLRVYQIAQAGRHTQFGEELFDSAAQLAAEWTGARDAEWEWDLLRRTTQKGARVGASLGSIFAAEAAATSPRAAFDRFAKTTGYLPVMQGALAVGQGVTLEVSSRTGGQRVSGSGLAADRVRELPFADLYSLGSAQMALLAVPEEGGYRATMRAGQNVSAALHLLAPGANGALRMVRWTGVSLSAGGVATAELSAAASSFVLMVDSQGDGVVDDQIPGDVETLTRRPFQALAAVLNTEVDPTGHVVEVLFTTDVDPASLFTRDATRFTIPGKVSNGGLVQGEQDTLNGAGHTVENPFEGLRNTRIVRVVFNNPLSPYAPQELTVKGVKNPLGEQVTATTVEVAIPGNAMPGTMVEGTVFGPDGKPVPFAEVELRESDACLFCEESCRTHKTAVVRADAGGNFLFDYVRQTACSDIYQLKATDATNGHSGTATGRVRFVGQRVRLDVLMLGRGTVRGRVTYENGAVPEEARVIAESPVFREARAASIDANGNFSISDVPVGTITLSASDGQGRFVVQTIEVPAAGAVAEHNLVILRQPETPPTNGEIRGKILRPDGETPVAGAYVALYVDGKLVGTRRSNADGTYDFGLVPAGHGEIETFEGETGQSGVQVFFELLPDRVNEVDLVMREERGVVTGFVYRKVNGSNVPLFGAIVWAEGTPFKTVTDAQGRYTLEGVFAGTRNISVADLEKKAKLSQAVTIGAEGQIVEKNFYFQDASSTVSGIAGEVLGFDGSPVFGATVHLAAGDQHWYRTAHSDASGRFAIPDLGIGSYEVHAFKGTAGGKAVATIRFVGDTPFITIRFKKGMIRGTVKAESAPGNLVGITAVVTYRTTAVRLELVGLDLESHNITTDANGNFEIPEALAGPYVLTVTNSFYGTRTVRGDIVNHGDAMTHDFVFEADRSGNISGTVLDQDAVTPVQGAKVVLRHPAFNNFELTTDAEGRFKFELVPPVTNAFPIQVSYDNGVFFRKAEAWVRYNQKGQDLDVEIVLPKQGSISGRVADANGVVVPGAVVTLQESAYPRRRLVINADAEGNFEFNNIFAGTVTLSARAPSLGGLGGKTTVEIVAEGEEVAGVTIFLEPTGKVLGQVTLPPAPPALEGSVVASAEVRLLRNGWLFDAINADTEGRFEFNLLPLGWYEVIAFDPQTGRFGRSGAKYLGANNQELAANVQLEARGTVNGHLYEPGTTLGVPGATIQLNAQSIRGFTTYSSTGADGSFSFLGIPQGRFDLTTREPGGRRRASGKGEIVSEGQTVTVDLFLDRQGTIIGSVLNPIGDPDGKFPNANTLIYQTGQIVGATLSSDYEFRGIILNEWFRMRTEEVGGPHRGEISGYLREEGPVRMDVRMRPIGSVKVDVLNSFGAPVPAAQLEMISEGFYGSKRLYADTGTDNSALFQDIGEGRVSVYATDPATGLKGSASGVVSTDGEIVQINLQLQSSGTITGVAVLADGTTPAVNALVALQIGGRTLTTFTDANGAFTFPSVPLGSFLLVFQESFGPGIREIRGSLATNGQVLNLGTVVLDDTNPKVVEIAPAAGSVDLPLNTIVVVRFSEPMRTTGALVGNLVTLRTAAGQYIGYNSAWIDGNTAIRLTPSPPLQNFTTYSVRVLGEYLYDAAGRRMDQGLQFSFTTADVLPPTVIEVNPADNAKQVPLSAQVRLTFNESVNELSLSGGHVQLTDVTTGANLATTFILDNPGRVATVTPVDALIDGHEYRITVNGVADKVGNAMTVPVVSRFFTTDTTPPVISNFLPAEGASYTSGDRILVSATVTDPAGVGSVALRIGNWLLADNTAPYSWNVPAPVMASVGNVTMELEVADTWGNAVESHRTVQVQPRSNAQAPQVDLGCLTRQVVPGVQIEIPFHLTDDERIESYRLTVDGATIHEVLLADAADVNTFIPWTVPASAAPGSTLALHIEARDFAGNVTGDDWEFEVVAGIHLTGDQTLNGNYAGQTLFLAKGTFTAPGPLNVEGLILPRGVTLKPAAGTALQLTADGRVEVACEAKIDVSFQGYAGGTSGHPAGYAPAGVTASGAVAGGSHGGRGTLAAAGEVYDSVYAPRQGGGGGGYSNAPGGAGGGLARLDVGELALGGKILALGKEACGEGAGAGGTVAITADVVGGAGTIDASGGRRTCGGTPNAGGGGRVSIATGTFDGFDPASQVAAWGGGTYNVNSYAAPGTIYYRKTGDVYGALMIDAGETNGVDNVSLATELPALGSGTVTATQVAGDDLWVSAGTGFAGKWLGVSVRLRDAAGADLGVFQVAEIDGAGRLRLADAAAVTGAVTYQGEYRFDRIELKNGAGLDAKDPLLATDSVVSAGDAELTGHLTGATATVKNGATLRPASGGGELRMTLTGKLTVEATGALDVSTKGYAGGTSSHPAGYAPAGVTPSGAEAGGSHGGRGAMAPAGEVYDSVYAPRQGGGGGGYDNAAGGAGGGVVRLDVGELELAGKILALGKEACGEGAGAGGTVAVTAGVVGGAGTIDASGGRRTCGGTPNAGGGGRVSIVTGTWNGFNPASQVTAWGGGTYNVNSYAAPGTIYYREAGDLYGTLQIDAGETNGVDNRSLTTDLPGLGSGTVTAAQVAGGDLWVSAGTGFAAKWLGVWVRLRNAGGVELGVYPVVEIDGAGRIRLADAAAAAAAATYQGEYRFDQLDLKNGAGLQSTDPIVGPEVVLEGNALVGGAISAANVRVKSGAVVRPASGSELRITTPGKLTIEAGGTLDVTGLGYPGGTASHTAGYAPEGMTGAAASAGGGHGGRGNLTGAGGVYDSVYAPKLAGGGGGYSNSPGGAGGGVVWIEAGELELAGTILAKGATACGEGAGGGGTVNITTGAMSGAGAIDASGGRRTCGGVTNGGGGGRVAIVTGTFDGFDPASQVAAWGGGTYDTNNHAAPGTIYYRKTGDVHGALLIDAGETGGVDQQSLATELPVLGTGAVTATEAAGDDLWMSASAGFAVQWLGVGVRLRDAAGVDLGVFRVAEIDGAGRLRLAGATAVTGAATYQGEYRFDRIELKNGAGLDAKDPLLATDSVISAGDAELTGHLTGATATVKNGATLRPAAGGGELRMTLTGKLTVEGTGALDVSAKGYAGGTSSHPAGYAPAGVTPSGAEAGGSHGGRGVMATAGEIYDSVYAPRLGGGGGGYDNASGGAGGGVVRLDVGELALAGKILALGKEACGEGAGAGGTVAITAGVVGGTGKIDASGGRRTCGGTPNSGGGGRVSIVTGTWNGFDPASQVTAWGGGTYNVNSYAAPGTIYYRKTGDVYGTLQIDAGENNGVDNQSLTTDLPALGSGTVTATQVAGGDLWVSAGTGFAAKWLGVWVRLRNAGGTELGAFPVVEIDGAGRIRLADAAVAVSAATYQGEYRFDQLDLKNGAGLQATDPIVGPELVLEGNALVGGTISAANVRVKSGAVVRPASGSELRITTPGRLTIEANATLDVTGKGYAGGSSGHPFGYAPDGVTPSKNRAAGSHGGRGRKLEDAGEVYDSVYDPRLAGGGGSFVSSDETGAGGGVIRIEAGAVTLDGKILAQGQEVCGSPGAGGTVSIVTNAMGGTGLIDASGGIRPCSGGLNPGGGGRVAIVTGVWEGFDPLTQVKAWGARTHETENTYAAPGTIYYRQAGDPYGSLLIDAGEVNATTDRVGPTTELPVLGTGAVTATEAAGDDLWVSAATGFAAKWLGVWVRLRSATVDLGVFRVAEIDGAGRLRLADAAAATDAATYQGEYRFDRIELKNGAGLDAKDPLLSTASVVSAGDAELTGHLTGATATVKSGATLRPAAGGGELRMTLTGKLTVEANASLDVTGTGYAGGDAAHPDGYAPTGVTGSTTLAGGSHGGRGAWPGAGEVYDSVYAPKLAGGGGAYYNHLNLPGAGGGVVWIEAGEVELGGTIVAKGQPACVSGAGAGGTVRISTGVMGGAGRIDASGGNRSCGGSLNGGGGGRVAIVTGTWNGFDPEAQVTAWGGATYDSPKTYASAGTVYHRKTGDAYGTLLIDAGETNGVDNKNLVTELPVLGSGMVTATEVTGGDLWVSAGAGFAAKWLGAWVRLRGASGADLGAFEVKEIDGAGRLRLASASAATGAASYQGEYRFDRVAVKNGAGLDAQDPLLATDSTFDGESELAGALTGATSTVKAGAILRPARGSELRIALSGKLTVEATGSLNVTSKGYAGGTAAHPEGYAPAGVTGSVDAAGGSHGGQGGKGVLATGAGEVYDSVFTPRYAGGGGGFKTGDSDTGGTGGGVVRIDAGELVLNGTIEARAEGRCGPGSGAGGTVSIVAGVVGGAGTIDVSGAPVSCSSSYVNGGGGGRVSIIAGAWNGFNAATQVKAYGGPDYQGNNPAAAGTVYTKTPAQTYGDLRVDQGRTTAPASVGVTIPTSIGRGTVGAVAGEAGNPTALWIEPQDPAAKFGLGVVGMWVRVNGVDYPVLAERSDRRGLLLGGAAGAVTAGQAFFGVYKLDSVTVAGRASLEFRDLLDAPTPSVASGSALVLFDIDPPVVNITQPAAGTIYNSGQTVQVAAQVTDNRTVTSVTFRLGEQSFVDTAAPYEWSVGAPSVAAEIELPITVEAVDIMNNRTTATRPIVVRPLPVGPPPAVAFTCPTSGLLLPPGFALSMTVAASHANGIEKVELLEGTTVLATDFQAPYAFTYTVPANALDGQVVTLKARARAFSGTVAEVPLDIRVLQGTVVSANRTVGASDTSLENASVIVTGGTLTVTGPHTFRDLVVLNGAKVTHPDTTDTAVYKLELTLQRDLYVGCGATVDVTARGYRGGGTRAYGYGNSTAEGANPGVGGSHGGRGGNYDGSSPVYGSFHDPRDPGAGGGYHSGNGGGRSGGGVVRVTASGVAIVDGSVLANGESYLYGNGGAGGSIRLNAQTLKGLGTISASGGIAGGSQAGGGGGRIALYAASVSPDLLSRTIAKGGQIGGSQAWGAAGTIFVKPDAQALGDLILDNGGVASPHYTELMTVGRGVVDAVATDGFTDNEADFRHFLGAAEVAFNGDLNTLYPILNHTHHGTSLTLAVPTPPLSASVQPGATYEGVYRFNSVIVRNGAKGIAVDTVITGNTPGSNWTSGYTPTVTISSPAAGTTYGAGTNFSVAVSVQSVLGVKSVTFQFNGQTFVDTASPYTWTFTAPAVNEGTDFVITAMVTDLSGNRFGTTRTIRVNPAVDPNAPVVALGSCPMNGDTVVAGATLTIPFTATDDQSIQDYSLVVDGVAQQTVTANQAAVSSSFNWTPPAGAAPGTPFVVRVQARDFAGGVGFASMTLTVSAVAPLTGNQSLTSARNGQALSLGAGTFTVQEPLSLASLTLLNGARVVGLTGQTLDLTVAGTVRVQCGAQLDASHLGYAGGQVANAPGGKPAWVTASLVDAGGSHGGIGSLGELAGPAGEVYGSVYEPLLGGGGGSVKHSGRTGGSGGGTLRLTASGVVLDGEILARGQKRQTDGYTDSSGAGGSILITAGTLSGGGRIDASGGDYQYYYWGGSGGGGRVALYVDTLSGFDPAVQVKAWGGALLNTGTNPPVRYAGPGTVFVKTTGQTYGRLIVNAGKESNGSERMGPQTPLPALGTGAVTAFGVQGADALVTAGSAFKPQWVGAWMALEDATGASLGSFRVLSIDAQGKALLKDAAAATAAAVYRGQYRFDRIDLKSGAGLSSADALIVSGDVVAEPKSRLPAELTAANVTLKPGAAVTVSQGGSLTMTLSGQLTVEAGAALDVTGLGYAGGSAANTPGAAPAGVTASLVDAGGSHGGIGSLGELAGPAGEVYGSVYEPRLGGGGGSVKHSGRTGGNGGGTLRLTASGVVLDGEILARGQRRQQTNGYTDSSGAGGSILITAGTLSGAGFIDASGGDYQLYYWGGSGGGGRVALYVDTLSGFDPAVQVKTWGGTLLNTGTNPPVRYAGPGTVFVKTTGQTYGRLIVNAGKEANGAERIGPQTPLPALGTGAVTAFGVQGADALVTAGAAFKPQWVGAWMALEDATGASLGSFRVLSIDAQGKALLKDAAAAAAAAVYRGQYRFDHIDLKSGAGLSSVDPLIVSGDVVAEPKSRLPADLTAANVTLKNGAAVTVSQGGSLKMTLSGRLTVEAGAALDVTGLGYAGGSAANTPGAAPAGVAASLVDAGGSHGGIGSLGELAGPAGEVYGSVYEPRLGGGGGSMRFSSRVAGGGGGTILLNVSELVLDGAILARGQKQQANGYTDSSGAGGSILITAGTLSGAGLIDASGGDYGYNYWGGSGGGGRVALYADTLSGFDPAAQIRARGGVLLNGATPAIRYASPGTFYVKLPADTHGKLYVDQGGILAGKAIPNSPLPSIGVGTIGTATADTATPTALWIEPSDPNARFALGAVGMWVRVDGTDYRVIAQTADRRKLLLAGAAGTVTTGAAYRGVYKFDEVFVRGGAKLEFRDTNVVGTFTVDATSSVIQNVP
ncbi:MAG TPA: carboxypeptidase regulatory-like domain-containing protein [Thermoanaerobaculia bacterium]